MYFKKMVKQYILLLRSYNNINEISSKKVGENVINEVINTSAVTKQVTSLDINMLVLSCTKVLNLSSSSSRVPLSYSMEEYLG